MKQAEALSLADGIWRVLVKHRQQHLLPQVTALLEQKFTAWQGQVVVESAHKLSISEQKKLMVLLKKNYGITEAIFTVEPSLIGGMKVHFGDKILDLSTKLKLEQLANSF